MGSLWIVDAVAGRFARLRADGIMDFVETEAHSLRNEFPRQIRSTGSGFLLLFKGSNAEGRPQPVLYSSGPDLAAGLAAGLDERVAVPDEVLWILDYQQVPGGTLTLALVAVDANTPGYHEAGEYLSLVLIRDNGALAPVIPNFEFYLAERDENDVGANDLLPYSMFKYSLDNSMRVLAAAPGADKAYLLLLQNPVQTIEIDTNKLTARLLENFPEGFGTFVDFGKVLNEVVPRGAERLSVLMKLKEEEPRLPSGLFANNEGEIFLLGRTGTERGVRWAMIGIDPVDGSESSRSVLTLDPGTAHVLIAPPQQAGEFWGVLTKTAVQRFRGYTYAKSVEYIRFAQW